MIRFEFMPLLDETQQQTTINVWVSELSFSAKLTMWFVYGFTLWCNFIHFRIWWFGKEGVGHCSNIVHRMFAIIGHATVFRLMSFVYLLSQQLANNEGFNKFVMNNLLIVNAVLVFVMKSIQIGWILDLVTNKNLIM